jgi:uncharacterized membrane protein
LPALMLLLSLVLAIIPLAGIAWIIVSGSIFNVDGLFMSLILLTLSGIFFLNAAWELRDGGFLTFLRKERAATKEPPAPKSS